MESVTEDGKLTCTRFDDIALIWLEGQADLNHVGVLSPATAETTYTRDRQGPSFRSRVVHFAARPHVV